MPWYHVSHWPNMWIDEQLLVKPRVGRTDDKDDSRELTPFIAVAPSISQAIVAIGDWDLGKLRVYKSLAKYEPIASDWVFDFSVTSEHRYQKPTMFEFVKELDSMLLLKKLGIDRIIYNNVKTLLDTQMQLRKLI